MKVGFVEHSHETEASEARWRQALRSFGFWQALFVTLIGVSFFVVGIIAVFVKGNVEAFWAPLFFLGVAGVGLWQLVEQVRLQSSLDNLSMDTLIDGEPGTPRVFRASTAKWLIVFGAGLAFALPGWFMRVDSPIMGWFSFGLFGLVCLVALVQLTVARGRLTLTAEGFEVSTLGRTYFERWEDVSVFQVVHMKGGPFVGYDRYEDYGKKVAAVNQALVGTTGILPDTYGVGVVELAMLMNNYRDNALKRPASEPLTETDRE